MNKNQIIGLIAVIILGIALITGISYYKKSPTNSTPPVKHESYEFHGNVDKIQGNTLFVRGVFMDKDGQPILESAQDPSTSVKSVQIEVAPSMQITRTALTLPTTAELKKTNGQFNVDDLKKSDSMVKFQAVADDFAKGTVSIYAKSAQNIFGVAKFTPSELSYRVGISQ